MNETELLSRLERLERDNRRLKSFVLGGAVLGTLLTVVYLTSCSLVRKDGVAQSISQKVTAREFDVVDDTGKVRVRIGSPSGVSSLALYDNRGHARIFLDLASSGAAGIGVTDTHGKLGTELGVLSSGEPVVSLSDGRGFQMVLGSTDLAQIRTGSTEETSAASIVMFGNDKKHHVIWRAPLP